MYKKIPQFFLLSLILIAIINPINSTLQIKISDGEQKCFLEELFQDSILSIKWKVELGSNLFIEKRNKTKVELLELVPEELIRRISITIVEEKTREVIKTFNPQYNKEKESFKPTDSGTFAICVQFRTRGSQSNDDIFFSMKLNSNNMDEPRLQDVVKTHHLSDLYNQTDVIVAMGKEITNKQKAEINDEDHFANLQLGMVENYNCMVCIQLIVMILLCIYQIWSFKKFLIANNII